MSSYVELRVGRANLVTTDDQIEQLFGSDVADRLLRDVRARTEGRTIESRYRQEPDLSSASRPAPVTSPAGAGRRRPVSGLLVAGAVAAIVIVLGVINMVDLPGTGETGGVAPVEVTSTAVCTPTGVASDECVAEASDPRVSGVEIREWAFDPDNAARVSGTVRLTNENGSWTGTFTAFFDGLETHSENELIGSGSYEGLVYTFTGGGPSNGSSSPRQVQRTGVIVDSD